MAKYFEKVLVANRGEIALRIMQTLKKLGIKTVAIYSEADTNSLHAQFADEAVYVGPSPATESYLSIQNIVRAALKTGATAVHPGYGFLSENGDFAKALAAEKIQLIGPSEKVIRIMGDKIEAKKAAKQANVNSVPGFLGEIDDIEHAKKIAGDIGLPIIIKAAAGGGGRGMRVVNKIEDIGDAFNSAKREAANSFRDNRIFIERYITNPRHIEIQVLVDNFGNILCLGERECSIQRHHQKIIEEAPSAFISEETRQKMYQQSVELCKLVKYTSAGTVEFIVDQEQNFYFLEMNTRLQVEHCVTELVTGIDIVEQMVKIAAGERLNFKQKDINLNGHAIESRIYSEDPTRGFIPSCGRINEYKEPSINKNIRIDSGVKEGHEVSMFYDPMIAKLCTHANTRLDAINLMNSALGSFVITGISHNISFLQAIMSNPAFVSGDISTSFIDQQYPAGFLGAELTSTITEAFLGSAIFIHMTKTLREFSINNQLRGRDKQISTRWVVIIDDKFYSIFLRVVDNGYQIRFENRKILVKSNWVLGNNLFHGMINDNMVNVGIINTDAGYIFYNSGVTAKVRVYLPKTAELDQFIQNKKNTSNDNNLIKAPMSGKVVQLKVKVGDEVKIGQELAIIEAMKMENIVYSDKNVKIAKIFIQNDDLVAADQEIFELEQVNV